MFIVIDISDKLSPMIACDPDSQEPFIFLTREEAKIEADEYQEAIIVGY